MTANNPSADAVERGAEALRTGGFSDFSYASRLNIAGTVLASQPPSPAAGEHAGLVDKLTRYQKANFSYAQSPVGYELLTEAATAIRQLTAQVERLEAALEPFAKAEIRADDYDNDRPALARVSDYRRARAAQAGEPTDAK